MLVIVRFALRSAPQTDFRTQSADVIRKTALTSHHLDAQFADVDALDATARTFIVAFHDRHGIQALDALDETFLTSSNTCLLTHDVILSVSLR